MSKDIQRLLDLECIKQLKSRYCRYIDSKQWDLLTGSNGSVFVKGVSSRLDPAFTMHHCHTPDIVFIDDDSARGVWAMADYMEWPEPIGLPDAPKARGMYGFGHYEEEYRRIDGQWKMSHLRLRRMRLIPLPDDHPRQSGAVSPAGNDWLPVAAR